MRQNAPRGCRGVASHGAFFPEPIPERRSPRCSVTPPEPVVPGNPGGDNFQTIFPPTGGEGKWQF